MMMNQNTPVFPTQAVVQAASDSVTFQPSMVYVGTTGNVAVGLENGSTVVFPTVPAGSVLPVMCTQLRSTSTTASNFVRIW